LKIWILVALFLSVGFPFPQSRPSSLPPWTPGTLDIHQLSTGEGNAALIVMPDGTTLLVDAGAAGEGKAGVAIASYIAGALGPAPVRLDYALLTHYHADHVGGIGDVAERIPIATVIDRGDEYLRPPDDDPTFARYRAFLRRQTTLGSSRETIRVGRADQIVLRRDRAAFPSVDVRNVAANGDVWSGQGDNVVHVFPPLASLSKADIPSENMCSIGLRIRDGRFTFFTGGDMPGVPDAGAPAWWSVETAVARAIGPTAVHVANHHGSIDPESAVFLAALRSPVIILPSWSITHPSQDALKRMLATRLYPGPHDIFATALHAETRASIGTRAGDLKAAHGHIVVRVEPGGEHFRVFVLDETADARPAPLIGVFGPYASVRP
jgi:beta-lactamase superfamily II metal-dependent hydrolase